MSKFINYVITNTYSSEITYDEWLKRINNFFHDKRIVQLLKENGIPTGNGLYIKLKMWNH